MNSNVLNFTLLMRDADKLERDLKKIRDIVAELSQYKLQTIDEVNVLWTVSPDSSGDLPLFFQAFERPVSKLLVSIEGKDIVLNLRQIHPNIEVYEQERFLRESERKSTRSAMDEDKAMYRRMKALFEEALGSLERSADNDSTERTRVLNIIENIKKELKNFDGTIFDEPKEAVKDLINILETKFEENSGKESIKSKVMDIRNFIESVQALAFDPEDRLIYEALSQKSSDIRTLSNILSLSAVQKIPGRTINLETFSTEDVKKLILPRERRLRPLGYDELGNISHIHAPLKPGIKRAIAREKNRQYKKVFSKPKIHSFFDRFKKFVHSFIQLIRKGIFFKTSSYDFANTSVSPQNFLAKSQHISLNKDNGNVSQQLIERINNKADAFKEQEETFYDALEQQFDEDEKFYDASDTGNISDDDFEKISIADIPASQERFVEFQGEGLISGQELFLGLSMMEKMHLAASYNLPNKFNEEERENLYALAGSLKKEDQLKAVQAILNNNLSLDEQADLGRLISNENISRETQVGLVKLITEDFTPKERQELLKILADKNIEPSQKIGLLPILGGDIVDKHEKINYLQQIKRHKNHCGNGGLRY